MKRSFLLLSLLGAGLLALGFWLWQNDPQQNALSARELATRGLASYLAEHRIGRRALVVSNPFTRQNATAREIVEMEEAGLRGVKLGLGTSLALDGVGFPELKPEARTDPRSLLPVTETTTPLSYLVVEDSFDRLAREHPDCDVFVSLIGLPADLERVAAWRAAGPPRFALLLPDLRVIGSAATVQDAVKSGKLAAFVLNKPGGLDSDARIGQDWAGEFAKRFLLVTAENVDQITQQYPQLFSRE